MPFSPFAGPACNWFAPPVNLFDGTSPLWLGFVPSLSIPPVGAAGASDATHAPPITMAQLLRVMPKAGTTKTPFPVADMLATLNATLAAYEVNGNRKRQAAFLAQIAHECAALTQWDEKGGDAYFAKHYEGKKVLGNTQKGDGVKFHGRGPMQLTGRDNYARCGAYLRKHGYPTAHLDATPDLLKTDLKLGFQSAGWYWGKNHKRSANVLADKLKLTADPTDPAERAAFNAISLFVNGGHNGEAERYAIYRTAVAALAGPA